LLGSESGGRVISTYPTVEEVPERNPGTPLAFARNASRRAALGPLHPLDDLSHLRTGERALVA
jgi:hypothetical protein